MATRLLDPLDGDTDSADVPSASTPAPVADFAAGSAISLLKADHQTVKELFEQVLGEDAAPLSGKRSIIDRIVQELDLHAKLEETIFYPALRQKSKRDTEERQGVLEAYEEHAAVKDLIRKIKRTTGRDETLRAKVQVLKEMVEHHVEEEESAMFPEAERVLGEKKLRQLGAEIATAKERALGRGKRSPAKASKTAKKGTAAKSTRNSVAAPAKRSKA